MKQWDKSYVDSNFREIENENLEVVNEFSRWFYNYFDGIDQITGNDAVNQKFKNVLEVKTMFATKLEEYKKELLAEGREEGRQEGMLVSAKKLKEKGLSEQKIADLLDLDIKEVKNL